MMMGLLVSIYKNGKVFLATLVCALVLTVAVSYMMTRNTYVYKQMIQTPSYFDGKGAQNILDNTKINVILQSMLKQIQDSNPDDALLQNTTVLYPFYDYEGTGDDKKIIKNDNYNIKQKYDQQTMFFTLFVSSKNADAVDVEKVYNNLLKQFSDSQVIQKQIELWKKSLQTRLKLDNDNLSRNEKLLEKNQKFLMDLISKQTSILGMDGQLQSVLLKYIGNIDSYQNKIFSLQDSIALTKLKLDNVEPKLSSFGKSFSLKAESKSMTKILVIGIILSFLLAIAASLFMALCRKVIDEANKEG